MDKKDMKLAYSEKYNQFYEIMRIDNDVGVCYIKPTSNKRDKSIHRDMILKTDTEEELEIVVMHNANITAEQHFIKIMESDCPYKIKLSELRDFKRNMLKESLAAMDELKKISETKTASNELQEVQTSALKLLTSLDWRQTVVDNRASYNQSIPSEIMKIALSKRLFIERRDEFCRPGGRGTERIPATGQSKVQLQSNFPCGYLIRNRGGYVIAGKGFTLTDQNVIEFVKHYIPSEKEKHYSILHRVPMSLRKKRQLAKCYNILKQHGLHYKNEHNYFFWVLDKQGKIIAGGKNGFGFKWLKKYCNRLNNGAIKKVTDKVQRSNR